MRYIFVGNFLQPEVYCQLIHRCLFFFFFYANIIISKGKCKMKWTWSLLKRQGMQTGSVYVKANKHKKVQFARIWTAYKLQYFSTIKITCSLLPVFRSSLTILHLISCLVFISSQPQTPLVKANLTKTRMLCNTVWLCTHFCNYHFARKTLN